MKTIIFYTMNQEEAIKSVEFLINTIKSRHSDEEAHRLYFKYLMSGAYMVSMGCEDKDGIKHFIGEHEIIFIPASRELDIERLKKTKDVIWYKNSMIIAGDGESPTKLRESLVDWLLEKVEDFNNS